MGFYTKMEGEVNENETVVDIKLDLLPCIDV